MKPTWRKMKTARKMRPRDARDVAAPEAESMDRNIWTMNKESGADDWV